MSINGHFRLRSRPALVLHGKVIAGVIVVGMRATLPREGALPDVAVEVAAVEILEFGEPNLREVAVVFRSEDLPDHLTPVDDLVGRALVFHKG